jgi:hypothetical protein
MIDGESLEITPKLQPVEADKFSKVMSELLLSLGINLPLIEGTLDVNPLEGEEGSIKSMDLVNPISQLDKNSSEPIGSTILNIEDLAELNLYLTPVRGQKPLSYENQVAPDPIIGQSNHIQVKGNILESLGSNGPINIASDNLVNSIPEEIWKEIVKYAWIEPKKSLSD